MFSIHAVSHYSIGDSSLHVEDLITTAKQMKWPAVCLIENHTLSSVIEFFEVCKSQNITGIIGCRFRTNFEGKWITLIARNKPGYQYLVKLLGKSQFIQGESRIDLGDVLPTEDVILVVGVPDCVAESPQMDYKSLYKKFKHVVVAKSSAKPLGINKKWLHIAWQPVVYLNEKDDILTQVLFADKIGQTIYEAPKFANQHLVKDIFIPNHPPYHVQPSEKYDPASLELLKICESYDVTQNPQIPKYCENSIEVLKQLCREGWKLKNINKWNKEGTKHIYDAYVARIRKEIDVFDKANLSDYILLVKDLIKCCKDNKSNVGLRGSAAGCIVSYLIGVSEIDPVWPDKSLEYHPERSLMFERFFNAARANAMPDVDIDVCPGMRNKLKEYITNKYGEANVSQNIVTFNRYDGRGALKTILRVFDSMSADEADRLTGNMINKDKISDELEDIRQTKPKYTTIEYNLEYLESFAADLEPYQKELDIAIRISDNIFTSGKHAAGTVISPAAIADIFPTTYTKDGVQIIGLEMEHAEKAGAVKYDLLCVSAYEKIDQIQKMVTMNLSEVDETIMDGEFTE